MRPLGFVLVHGFGGSPADLAPLAASLAESYGTAAVTSVQLPGHDGNRDGTRNASFDGEAFLAAVSAVLLQRQQSGEQLVLVGHSTGGNLLLDVLVGPTAEHVFAPDDVLLVALLATPPAVDASYAERWNHWPGAATTTVSDVAALVSMINRRRRRQRAPLPWPVLVVHGSDDALVPANESEVWLNASLSMDVRRVLVDGAGHDLLANAASSANVVAEIHRTVEAARASHPALADQTAAEPVIANIEITTRCDLTCRLCARTQTGVRARDMSLATFESILTRLPQTRRIVLVGLGEPLLHPEVLRFIAAAVASERRVSLVTNAMPLDADRARALCISGISGITFSLDGADAGTLQRLRAGSDFSRIVSNIEAVVTERNRIRSQHPGGEVALSAFTALSVQNADRLEDIVHLAASLGLDAMMVSDVNFANNQTLSLHACMTDELRRSIRRALKAAARHRLPVLSVRGLEVEELRTSYRDYLLFRADQIAARNLSRVHCSSPWQTAVVNVDGDLSICDCQPDAVVGNIHTLPAAQAWNGARMLQHRREMLGASPPAACLACPRF